MQIYVYNDDHERYIWQNLETPVQHFMTSGWLTLQENAAALGSSLWYAGSLSVLLFGWLDDMATPTVGACAADDEGDGTDKHW